MEECNGDQDYLDHYDGIKSWVTGIERTERVVVEIRVGEILKEVVNRVVELGMRGQEPPRGIENSDVVQGCLDIEQFEMIKTV